MKNYTEIEIKTIIRPRYMVIAPVYDRYELEIGNIFILSETDTDDYFINDDINKSISSKEAKRCTGNFRKMNWWENISIEDLPTYLKVENSRYDDIFKIVEYYVYESQLYYVFDDGTESNITDELIPATEQEYLIYKNKYEKTINDK